MKDKKRTTLRKSIESDLKEARRTAMWCRRVLKTLPEELLDLPLVHAFSWFWKTEGQVHLSCDVNLGEEKGASEFRSVSAQLLALSGRDQVETIPNTFHPGRFDQRFYLPGKINVNLSWVDPELRENPCHTVKVTRVVEVNWCGGGDPPLHDGDVIVQEGDSDEG